MDSFWFDQGRSFLQATKAVASEDYTDKCYRRNMWAGWGRGGGG